MSYMYYYKLQTQFSRIADFTHTKHFFLTKLYAGQGFGLVVRAADWHAGNPGSNPQQGQPLYIWMYTPSTVNGMDMCAI
jgi:hypothetical protein